MSKRIGILGVLAGGLFCASGWLLAPAPAADPGKQVPGFTLSDPRDQGRVSLADFKDKKAIVVFFLGTECPINNAYMLTLPALHKEYSAKGVQFLAINSNLQDTPDRVATHARKNELPFPVLKDPGNAVADHFGAKRTPEAFVLDAKGTILYQGRIDDQFGIGYQRPKATERHLAKAIDEVLAGKPVSKPRSEVEGCIIARAAELKADGSVTYAKHISRLLQKNCQECHRPNHIGPMPLLTYDDASAWSAMIREVVTEGRMPPWHADAKYGHFKNDRSLAKEEREMLVKWIDEGCPKGNDSDMPAPKQFVEGWRIGKPDLIISMPEEFSIPANAGERGIPYKYFTVDPGFTEDKWVERAEAHPGAPEVVHHIIIFISAPTDAANAAARGRGQRLLVGTAPGDMPLILEPGMAKKVPAGSKLVFQMHYTPNGRAQKDRSSVGIVFAKEPPKNAVVTVGVSNMRLRIPPGEANYKAESEFTFPADAHIISFMPHMHVRGKDFLYETILPDGTKQTQLSVPRFDFAWQSVYRFANAPAVPKGTKLHCTAHYDNSTNNRNNPDPTRTVTWGDQTWEEMMIGWVDFYVDQPAK